MLRYFALVHRWRFFRAEMIDRLRCISLFPPISFAAARTYHIFAMLSPFTYPPADHKAPQNAALLCACASPEILQSREDRSASMHMNTAQCTRITAMAYTDVVQTSILLLLLLQQQLLLHAKLCHVSFMPQAI
jgi:hypothetical protein